MPNGNIFISYRRGPDSNAAGRLYDRLERSFDAEQLFFDIDSIPLGMDFAEHIDLKVAECDVQLVVIGPGWLENMARLSDQDDFVRIEVEAALSRDRIPVVPVLIDGAKMPQRDDLPETLQPLLRRNAIEISHAQFAQTVDSRLVEALRGHVSQSPDTAADASDAAVQAREDTSSNETGSKARPDSTPAAPKTPSTPPPSTPRTQAPRAPGALGRQPVWKKAVGIVVVLAGMVFVADRIWPDLKAPAMEVAYKIWPEWRLSQQDVTASNLVQADFESGSFVQVSQGLWNEVNAAGETIYSFRVINRDERSVYLCDNDRGVGIQLDAYRDWITYNPTCDLSVRWNDQWPMTAAWRERDP